MNQIALNLDKHPRFDGACFDPAKDQKRLEKQIGRVWRCMEDGQWYTLEFIATWTGDPEASVSAQIRNLRKPRFGGYTIEKKRSKPTGGTWLYRLKK